MISSEDIVQTDIFWLYKPWDLFFEDHIPIKKFKHDTPAHVDAPSYHTCLEKVKQFRSYLLDKAWTC